MHITQKLAAAHEEGRATYSFEFSPPKTAQGVQNLYDRIDRMHDYGPAFIDVTWGAGGRHSNLTCEMIRVAQTAYGLETCMHLTCTDMERSKIDNALREAYDAGCTNILALRGDPPRDREKWEQTEGGFRYARDLIKYIKLKYGDHFDIGVAGYPEGPDEDTSADEHITYLKEKVDAGGTYIITQMCYNAEVFIDWAHQVRAAGVPESVPIIPGIMPISTHASFLRRANFMNCYIPPEWSAKLDPIKNNDDEVREVGKRLVAEFCQKILDAGVTMHLHFYTMNLENATRMVLEELLLTPPTDESHPDIKPLPWRQSLGRNRREENVRPIFWSGRKSSYVARTQDWDEFPNGRWGDSRSPAFGELDSYGVGLKGTNEHNRKLWGEPKDVGEIADLFIQYLNGKVQSLPWSEGAVGSETEELKDELIDLNKRGFLTINSQPAVDGKKSSDPVHGWGPNNGYVYQKAYLELLVNPHLIDTVVERMEADPDVTYYAVNNSGVLRTNTEDDSGPNAVTWGVFPGKEIVQPTIVETISFLAWRDEFYHLGSEWSKCHEEGSRPRELIKDLTENWYLVNIVHNDFQQPKGVFPIFEGLRIPEFDDGKPMTNGHAHTNGEAQTNGEVHVNGEHKHSSHDSGSYVNGVTHSNVVVNGYTNAHTNGVTNGDHKH